MSTPLGLTVPAMVVTVPDAVWAQAEDITGSTTDLAAMMQTDVATLQNMIALRSTSFNLQIHPPAYYPDAIAVALKSNQYTYGPWGRFSANGKLNFEQDEGLVPWEYGGYDILNQVAIAKLNTIAMGNQVLERAHIMQPGIPLGSIGDQLVADGPIMTSIVCHIEETQVTTDHTMETFVNRIGAFTIENAERLRRIGKIYQQLRRSMRQLILTNIERSNIMISNYAGFMYGTSYAVEQHTPHGVLGARLVLNNSGTYTPSSWTQTYQESLANLGLNNDTNFISTACVGMEALLRPYTTNTNNDNLSILPAVDETVETANLIIGGTGLYTLNPLQDGCDIQWLVSGDTYSSLKTSKGLTDFQDVRSVALRGPIMVCGWGYDIQGNPVPNSGTAIDFEDGVIADFQAPLNNCNTQFISNYLQMSNQWPAAPLDLVYDKFRSVWASPGMVLHGTYSGGNYMLLNIGGQGTSELLEFTNWLGGSIPTGVRMQCCWNPLEKYWEAVSVACTTNN